MRCKTCFVDFEKDMRDELTLKEVKGIAAYLKGLVWLDIGGGEPFLREDLPDICAAFDTGSISIPTNGFDPGLIYDAAKKIRNKVKNELYIAVSIDGLEATNDDIRGKGSFKKAVETIKLLRPMKGMRLKINTVLCERNYDEIIDFMKFAKGLDLDFHSIIFRRGPMDALPGFDCPNYNKLQKVKADVFKIWDTYDYGLGMMERKILGNYQRAMYETSLRIIDEKRQIPDCLAGRQHLVVYANGDSAFCEMLEPFGNIRKTDIKRLLESKEAEAQRELIKRKKCYCYHNCNLIDNFFLNPLQYPKLLSGAYK